MRSFVIRQLWKKFFRHGYRGNEFPPRRGPLPINAIKDANKENVEWVFRGHKTIDWRLETTLERTFKVLDPLNLYDSNQRLRLEGGLLRRFTRQSQRYLQHLPLDGNIMEWLSLMRHHGSPCRLLDWTYSFWAAVFFAVVRAEGKCSVWVANQKYLWSQFKSKQEALSRFIDDELPRSDPNVMDHRTFRAVFMRSELFVCPVNSYSLNDRLVIQQGTFLCPGDISKTFEENLAALAPVINAERDFEDEVWELRLDTSLDERKNILRHLHRMNMNEATLYPGLDGFARSLETLVTLFPEMFRPEPDWV